MAHESTKPLDENNSAALAVVETQCFPAFDHWMDEQLEMLVARWIHAAAPNADKFNRVQQQFGRQGHKK